MSVTELKGYQQGKISIQQEFIERLDGSGFITTWRLRTGNIVLLDDADLLDLFVVVQKALEESRDAA